jgi:hypothetical protein
MTYNNIFGTMTSLKNVCQPTNCALTLHFSCTKKHNTGPSIIQICRHRNTTKVNPSGFISLPPVEKLCEDSDNAGWGEHRFYMQVAPMTLLFILRYGRREHQRPGSFTQKTALLYRNSSFKQ